jgi:type IV fimbrial biogenesis protein FimT
VLEPLMQRRRSSQGFTIIELMLVIAVTAVVVTLAVPSMRDFMIRQRLKAINAELVNDLQFARSESITRSRPVRVTFRKNADMTCYTIHTRGLLGDCDCRQPVGTACPDLPELVEIKTVQVPRSTTVQVEPLDGTGNVVLFSGPKGLATPIEFQVNVQSSIGASLRTTTNALGRPQICSPGASLHGVVTCAE